jgi:hypothetical protein
MYSLTPQGFNVPVKLVPNNLIPPSSGGVGVSPNNLMLPAGVWGCPPNESEPQKHSNIGVSSKKLKCFS